MLIAENPGVGPAVVCGRQPLSVMSAALREGLGQKREVATHLAGAAQSGKET